MTLTPPTNTCGNPTSSKPSVPTSASPARSSEAAAHPAAAGASSYPDREALSPIRAELLRWFRQNRRELPFREHKDPWRIWVSEVMLQQTRVEAMLPRYRAFVGRFPDAAALAAASTDEVLAAWSGLGYYRRARALHRAAREVVRSGFPNTAGGLRRLPGVGPYTAAAIASIAFAEPVAAVDGNVRRVLARLFAVSGPSDRAPFGKRIRGLADRLMAAGGARSPGDWNQAVMELGALVCVPRSPRCEVCPLRAVLPRPPERPGGAVSRTSPPPEAGPGPVGERPDPRPRRSAPALPPPQESDARPLRVSRRAVHRPASRSVRRWSEWPPPATTCASSRDGSFVPFRTP